MWWDELGRFSDTSVYFVMAASATLIFVIRLVFALFGADGDSDLSADADHGHGHDSTGAFKVFSLLSIMAFFMGAGWMGLAARMEWKWSGPASVIAATVFGLLLMLLASALASGVRRLNKETKLDISQAIGHAATVYLSIPEKGKGQGQIQVNVHGTMRVVAAMSNGPAIPAFSNVKVTGIHANSVLLVEPED